MKKVRNQYIPYIKFTGYFLSTKPNEVVSLFVENGFNPSLFIRYQYREFYSLVLNGSVQWKTRGVSKMAVVELWSLTVAINILFPFEHTAFMSKLYFLFLLIGDFVCNSEPTENRVAMADFWRIHCLTMEKSALTGEDGRCTPAPFHSIYHYVTKLQCTLQLREKIHFPYFYSTLYTVHTLYTPWVNLVQNRFISLIMSIPGFRTVNDALGDQW